MPSQSLVASFPHTQHVSMSDPRFPSIVALAARLGLGKCTVAISDSGCWDATFPDGRVITAYPHEGDGYSQLRLALHREASSRRLAARLTGVRPN